MPWVHHPIPRATCPRGVDERQLHHSPLMASPSTSGSSTALPGADDAMSSPRASFIEHWPASQRAIAMVSSACLFLPLRHGR